MSIRGPTNRNFLLWLWLNNNRDLIIVDLPELFVPQKTLSNGRGKVTPFSPKILTFFNSISFIMFSSNKVFSH